MPTFGTVVNPTKSFIEYLKPHASNSLAKSLVAVCTPQHANQLKLLYESFPHLQVVSFSSDTVPLGCQRNGFSFLFNEHEMKINDKQKLMKDRNRNWSDSTSAIRLSASKMDISFPTANTIFSTGQIAELYAEDGEPLHSVHLQMPNFHLRPNPAIRPVKEISGYMEITACVDNMLKTLDNNRAAAVLEENEILKTSAELQVFAEIQRTGEFVKVIAGGGGLWSPRSSMLVLEPPCTLQKGDKLKFWLQDDPNSSKGDIESQLISTPEDSVVAEVAPVLEALEERPYLEFKKNHHLSVFGFGSERGFLIGDQKHSIVGECVSFTK